MDIKYKAEVVHNTGNTVVEIEHADAVLKELENYGGIYYKGTEMNGLVVIERER